MVAVSDQRALALCPAALGCPERPGPPHSISMLIQAPLTQALEHCGSVDFLVCNAAVNPLVGSTLGASEQVWDKVRSPWALVGLCGQLGALAPPFPSLSFPPLPFLLFSLPYFSFSAIPTLPCSPQITVKAGPRCVPLTML